MGEPTSTTTVRGKWIRTKLTQPYNCGHAWLKLKLLLSCIVHEVVYCSRYNPMPLIRPLALTQYAHVCLQRRIYIYVGSCCAHIYACLFKSVCLPGTDVWEENGHILGEKKLACSRHSDSGERCKVERELGRAVRNLSPSLVFIFSRSFLIRTAPHYLNAWNRLERKKNTKQEILLIIRGKKPRVCRVIILKQMARPQ